jgi:hypothetical protein
MREGEREDEGMEGNGECKEEQERRITEKMEEKTDNMKNENDKEEKNNEKEEKSSSWYLGSERVKTATLPPQRAFCPNRDCSVSHLTLLYTYSVDNSVVKSRNTTHRALSQVRTICSLNVYSIVCFVCGDIQWRVLNVTLRSDC